MKIGVGLPTRGIIDTLTIESILKNTKDYDVEFFFTHNLPLPDSRIEVTKRFLESDCTHIWWIDDDMVIPDGHLAKLIEASDENTIATSGYYMQNGQTSVHYENGVATQCGFGCVLIHRNIIEGTPEPLYLTNLTKVNFGGDIRWLEDNSAWGGEDIWFYHQAVDKAGFKITEVKPLVGHLRIRDWGSKYLNKGVHDIYQLDERGQDGFRQELGSEAWHKMEKDYIDSRIELMKERDK